jgi:hypothetical protein
LVGAIRKNWEALMADGLGTKSQKGPVILALLIITVGVGWLLSAQGFGRGIDWVWTLGLAMVGVATFILSGGLDKLSVVLGPFFLVCSLLSVLRQTEKLDVNTEIPVLVILIGVLLLVAQARAIPIPRWMTDT